MLLRSLTKGSPRASLVPRRRRALAFARGVTLIEMMIVVAIVGIIAAVATPNLSPVIQRQKLLGGAEEVAALLDRARRKAFNEGRCYRVRKQGANLVLERKGGADGNGANCVGDASFDISGHAWDPPLQTVRPADGTLSYTISTTDGGTQIVFRPNGRLRGDGDWDVSDDGAQVEVDHPALGHGVALRVTPVGRICTHKYAGSAPGAGVVLTCP